MFICRLVYKMDLVMCLGAWVFCLLNRSLGKVKMHFYKFGIENRDNPL